MNISRMVAAWGICLAAVGLATACTIQVQPFPMDVQPAAPSSGAAEQSPPTTAEPSPTATNPTAPMAPSPPADEDGGCPFTMVEGTSANPDLQALATSVYSSLTCGDDVPIDEQLRAASQDPAFAEQASALGLVVMTGDGWDAGGGLTFTAELDLMDVSDPDVTVMCTVVTSDDPYSKGLQCMDIPAADDVPDGEVPPENATPTAPSI